MGIAGVEAGARAALPHGDAMIARIAVVLALFATSDAAASITIDVSLGGRTLDVRNSGAIVESYAISPGIEKHPTPKGQFRVRRIVWNPRWVPPKESWAKGKSAKPPGHPKNPMKVVKIFFKEPDYYIHGTAEEHLLGDPASHGCIRMAPADAYALARIIMENAGAKKSQAWYQSVLSGRRSTTVRLPRPVVITIAP